MDRYECGSAGGQVRSRRVIGTVAVVLLAASLSGCWLQIGNGPANARFNGLEDKLTIGNVATLSVEWQTDLDSHISEPIVLGNRIYLTSSKASDDLESTDVLAVQAYNRDSGELVWERSLLPEEGAVHGSVDPVILVDDALWVSYEHEGLPDCTNNLLRLDPKNGDILSSEETTDRGPIVASGSIFARAAASNCGIEDQLVVRDLDSRDILWSHTFPEDIRVSTPTIAHGKVYVVAGVDFGPAALYAFGVDGCGASVCEPLWVQDDIDGLLPRRPVAGPDEAVMVIQEGFTGEVEQDIVNVVDGATGAVQWRAEPEPGSVRGLAVAYDTLYVSGHIGDDLTGDIEGTLDAYPIDGCGELGCPPEWSVSFGVDVRPSTPPTVAGGVVYVGRGASFAATPAVVAIDAAGCGEPICETVASVTLAETPLYEASPYQMSIAHGQVFVAWGYPNLPGLPSTALFSLGPAESQ